MFKPPGRATIGTAGRIGLPFRDFGASLARDITSWNENLRAGNQKKPIRMSTKSIHVLGRVEIARRSLTVGLGALLMVPVALAQDAKTATAPGDAGELKPVTIRTGSNIPSAEEETVSPVTTYTAEEIAKMGVTDLSSLTQRLPISSQGGLAGNNGGTGFAQGGTGVSLRGLGLNATLVLLNGRRVAPFSYGSGGTITFVNLNSLPLEAVERVEILREGASAIYGADAIAGVINVVTKKDFDGLLIKARYGNTFSTDTASQAYSLTYGTHSKDNKTSVLIVADYLKQNSLFNRDRAFSSQTDATGLSVYDDGTGQSWPGANLGSTGGYPGYFTVPRNAPGLVGTPYEGTAGTRRLAPPKDTNGSAPASAYHLAGLQAYPELGSGEDLYNFLKDSQATPDSERYGIFGAIDHQIFDEKMVVFGTFQMQRDVEHVELAPAPISFAGNGSGIGIPLGEVRYKNGFKITGNQITIPVANPWNPFGADIVGGQYRFVEAGNRLYDTISHNYNFVAGLKGDIDPLGRLSYETAVSYSRSEDNRREVQIGTQQVQNALNDLNLATSLNLFGGANFHNNPATIEGLKVRTIHEAGTQIASWDGRIFGNIEAPFWKPGKFGYAVGTEYREERFFDHPDELSKAGALVGSSPTRESNGHRSSEAAFIESTIPLAGPEFNVPGIYRFDVKAAGRLDSYSDFGESVVPLVGLIWRPFNEDLLFRGTYGQSFRPPSLRQLFNAPQDALTGAPVRDPLRPGDLLPQVPIVTAGNPNLQPETSDNWSVGSVFTPHQIPGLRLEAQWFQIKRRNEISQLSQTLGGTSAIAGIPGNYTRDPYDGNPRALIDPVTGQLAGPLVSLVDSYVNVGTTIVDAIDAGVSYELKTETAGTWLFSVELTRMLSNRSEVNPGDGYGEAVGQVLQFDGWPKWRGIGSVTWDYRKLQLGAMADFRSGLDYPHPGWDSTGYAHVNSFLTFDLQASYNLPWQSRITVGIRNLMDSDPPLYIGDQGQWYISTLDNPFGRSYYMELSKKF